MVANEPLGLRVSYHFERKQANINYTAVDSILLSSKIQYVTSKKKTKKKGKEKFNIQSKELQCRQILKPLNFMDLCVRYVLKNEILSYAQG